LSIKLVNYWDKKKLYMFRTVPPSIIRSFSLYTQQRCMSYRFADSLRAGSGRNWEISASGWFYYKNDSFICKACSWNLKKEEQSASSDTLVRMNQPTLRHNQQPASWSLILHPYISCTHTHTHTRTHKHTQSKIRTHDELRILCRQNGQLFCTMTNKCAIISQIITYLTSTTVASTYRLYTWPSHRLTSWEL